MQGKGINYTKLLVSFLWYWLQYIISKKQYLILEIGENPNTNRFWIFTFVTNIYCMGCQSRYRTLSEYETKKSGRKLEPKEWPIYFAVNHFKSMCQFCIFFGSLPRGLEDTTVLWPTFVTLWIWNQLMLEVESIDQGLPPYPVT